MRTLFRFLAAIPMIISGIASIVFFVLSCSCMWYSILCIGSMLNYWYLSYVYEDTVTQLVSYIRNGIKKEFCY